MRKYYQVALAITAIVSLVSLLVYRHENKKLRFVLDVVNYFGETSQKSVDTNGTNITPTCLKNNMKFEEPVSAWQRLDDDVYMYSAYSIREKEVQVIGFGSSDSIRDMQCALYFEDRDEPVLGTFGYILINSNLDSSKVEKHSDYMGYHFLCTHTNNKAPTAISFLTKSLSNLNIAPMLPIKLPSQNLDDGSVAVCVVPPSVKQMHVSDMISFVNFHNLTGMNNFIVYDFGIPTKFNSYLKGISVTQNVDWKLTYTTIPWNFPLSGISHKTIRDIIQADCLYRTYNKATYAVTLSWEEYLVLKYRHTKVDFIFNFKQSRLKADRYKLETFTFCTQQLNDTSVNNSTFSIFRKTRFYTSITENVPTYINIPHNVLQKSNVYTQNIGKHLAVLNRYKYCNDNVNLESGTHDYSILKFMKGMQSSLIFKRFLADKYIFWR